MGSIRLCDYIVSKTPYLINGANVYTIEELCYQFEKCLYIIDSDVLNNELFDFISEELKKPEIANAMRESFNNDKDAYRCIKILFNGSGYYSRKELNALFDVIDSIRLKTPMERRKMKGDSLLAMKKYKKAAYTYLDLIDDGSFSKMPESLQGNIMHNLGVVYARLFMFDEAAKMFAKAYRRNKSVQTRDAYLFALNYLDDEEAENEIEVSFENLKNALERFTEVSEDIDSLERASKVAKVASYANGYYRKIQFINDMCVDYQNNLAN